MSFYLKVIGKGNDRIPGSWREPYAKFTPTHPPDNISKGDILILYAAGWQVIFGVARVIGRAPRGLIRNGRTAWRFDTYTTCPG